MSDDEANSRWEDLHSHVITQTAQSFVMAFLTRCLRVHGEHMRRNPSAIPVLELTTSPKTPTPAAPVELEAEKKIEETKPSFPTRSSSSSSLPTIIEALSDLPPDMSVFNEVAAAPATDVLAKYKSSKSVLFLIDFESTLWTEDPRVTREQGFVPPENVMSVLRDLVNVPAKKNHVWLLSGLPVRKLKKIAEAVPGLGLVAENGCFVKDPESQEWRSTVSRINFDWKPICLEILAYVSCF